MRKVGLQPTGKLPGSSVVSFGCYACWLLDTLAPHTPSCQRNIKEGLTTTIDCPVVVRTCLAHAVASPVGRECSLLGRKQ
ncbi:hypothetical protein N658DRAFT_495493 [Parathielavia hyrcaniae]|uniref:Uncharacterized protein n=1 Tax=Parathielavia hyrcaniae TaxID=113614 RepID=A0AAN6Q203_9PEZI|nr:hypothetical protein N658DRAFT_495493 [Parathielavia hyrcaniae]